MLDSRSLLVLILAAATGTPVPCLAQSFNASDRAQVAAVIARMTVTARLAWDARDASLLVSDSALTVRTPDGGTMTAAQLRADLQRRMNMTTRVDTLVEVLDSIRLITRDSILAYSSQRFVRLIRLDNGSERQRISTITHERPVIRSRGQWKLVGAVREIAPRAWWADEAPPAPAGLTGGTRNSAAVDTARALDSAWARSYATHDTVLAATLFSDRLMVTSADGRMKDKAAELADIRPAAGLHMHHFPTSDVRTEPFPGTAVVTGVADWAFRYNGQENALRRRYTAVYVRGGVLGWQLVALHLGRAP